MRLLWALLVLCCSAAVAAQPVPAPLSQVQKREIVEAAASAYADFYVFADKGRLIAAHLRRESSRGAFNGIEQPAPFAAALTAAIQAVNPDRHIEIVPPRAAPTAEG